MLKRYALDKLCDWFSSKRRKPVVIRGARQVGKSTLVNQFAKHIDLELITVNCEKNRHLDTVFASLNIPDIIAEIEALGTGKKISSETILFFDEIQATPNALQALRYFYEERPDIPVIAAGSLLEFTLSKHSFSMPVGRIQYLYIYPMSFKEFVLALEPDLIRYIEEINFDKKIPVTAHERLLSLYRKYILVGGMPEAVSVYKETGSFIDVNDIHNEILETYIDDFSKYAQEEKLVLLQRIFSLIPGNLGTKIKYVNLLKGERAASVRSMIDLLTKAQVIQPVWHSNCSGLPLGADINDSVFKLIFLDIGLASRLLGMDWRYISSIDNMKLINEGGIAEQFVGQQLCTINTNKPMLTYWHREGKANNAEVDYTTSFATEIFPVEVKSGASGSLKSIHQFIYHKKVKKALRFDQNQASIQEITQPVKIKTGMENVTFTLYSLPIYAVEECNRLFMGYDG